jgi:hypothetical protein
MEKESGELNEAKVGFPGSDIHTTEAGTVDTLSREDYKKLVWRIDLR